VTPVAGDNVSNIQTAINYVSALPLDANGFRGAVLLSNGRVSVRQHDLHQGQRSCAARHEQQHQRLPAPSFAPRHESIHACLKSPAPFRLERHHAHHHESLRPCRRAQFLCGQTSGLSVGAEVFVRRVATTNWIHDLGMDLLGPPPVVPWTASSYMMDMDRVIHAHRGQPHFLWMRRLPCAMTRVMANGTIRPFHLVGTHHERRRRTHFWKIRLLGSTTNETHGWTFISIRQNRKRLGART